MPVMFLIPAHSEKHLNKLLFRKTFRQVLHELLIQYSEFIVFSHWNTSASVSKKYQSKGLALVRIGAKVQLEDLLELKAIANGLGVSYCLLFSRMLELDELGWGKELREAGVVRTLPHHPSLLLKTQFLPLNQTEMVYRI